MFINGTMMQYFENELPTDKTLWTNLKKDAAKLAKLGITSVWLPPAFKGADGVLDDGYKPYDLYDLGEFEQKGTIATKYGTKAEYISAIKALHSKGINVYADLVINRKYGWDEFENITPDEFNSKDCCQMVGATKKIGGYTKYSFEGRKGKYSDFVWDWKSFKGIDWEKRIDDKNTEECDYYISSEIDFGNNDVREELIKWLGWYNETTDIDGICFNTSNDDNEYFYRDLLCAVKSEKELFAVGDYWHWDVNKLTSYINNREGMISLYDVPLHFNFHNCSKAHGNYDLRTILDGTLVAANPLKAVTFVDNHNSQQGQVFESFVEDWFKSIAYSIILLRDAGYPCVFYGDYQGNAAKKVKSHKRDIDKLLKVRMLNAYGKQNDYFDDPNCIGWTREGDSAHPDSGVAVVISDGTGGTKRMYIGKHFAGAHFSDVMGNAKYNIKIDEYGYGNFYVNRGAVAVWVRKEK